MVGLAIPLLKPLTSLHMLNSYIYFFLIHILSNGVPKMTKNRSQNLQKTGLKNLQNGVTNMAQNMNQKLSKTCLKNIKNGVPKMIKNMHQKRQKCITNLKMGSPKWPKSCLQNNQKHVSKISRRWVTFLKDFWKLQNYFFAGPMWFPMGLPMVSQKNNFVIFRNLYEVWPRVDQKSGKFWITVWIICFFFHFGDPIM